MFENNHLPGLGALLADSEPCTPLQAQRRPSPISQTAISSGGQDFPNIHASGQSLHQRMSMLNVHESARGAAARSMSSNVLKSNHFDQNSQLMLSERERLLALREEEVKRREREIDQARAQRLCGIEQFLEPENSHPNSYLAAQMALSRQRSFGDSTISTHGDSQSSNTSMSLANKPDLSVAVPNSASFSQSRVLHPLPKRPGTSTSSYTPSQHWNFTGNEPSGAVPFSDQSWLPIELSAELYRMQQGHNPSFVQSTGADMMAHNVLAGNCFTTPPETPHIANGQAPYSGVLSLPDFSGGYNYPADNRSYRMGNMNANSGSIGLNRSQQVSPYPHHMKSARVAESASDLSPNAAEFVAMPHEKTPFVDNLRYPWVRPVKITKLPPSFVPGPANWHQLVKRIITNNDQQASILLQQKIKNASAEDKFDMCQAILDDTLNLASNRFGNFLVQRCMEYGSADQVITLAAKLTGHVVELSKDSFGCHVMQKALDVIPEHYKRLFVQEMLINIRTTIIHRYACHVWQKLFELRWEGTPPQIMTTVNQQLTGIWTEVALGETGSLVVQNIFENCVEEDKRACIEEVLHNIELIARGQFGNWCIQHICENGADTDRARALTNIVDNAAAYSTDQFGSKVVEKCLKVAGPEFGDRYIRTIAYKADGQVRSALIDIAGDQYGNYLIQWILSNASMGHREVVAAQVRQHMVSLRGSKYGARVAVMCGNPIAGIRTGRSLTRGTTYSR